MIVAGTGLVVTGSHHAHALHTPYWWLRCAVGVGNERARSVRLYHRLLVWDIVHPSSPLRVLERALNPIAGKSLVVYVTKPARVAPPVAAPREPVGAAA